MKRDAHLSSTLFVSVIVPVYNDTERLSQCLEKLSAQSWPKARFEIIVVDNGSTEPVEPLIRPLENLRFISEPQPGSYAARNAGIKVAKGDLFAFTDSDCLPEPQWLEKGVERFWQTENCGSVGGGIRIFPHDPARPTAVELYDQVMSLRQETYVKRSHYAVTANMFTSRKIMEEVGMFDGTLKSSGDRDWGQRVYHANYQVVYEEAAVVWHPARYSWAELRKKTERLAGGYFHNPNYQNFNLKTFLPPFYEYKKIWRSEKIEGFFHRLKAIGAASVKKYFLVRELIRLQNGAESKR